MPETRHFFLHCEEKDSLSTIHRHKQLYYDENRRVWIKSSKHDQHLDSEPDEDFDVACSLSSEGK